MADEFFPPSERVLYKQNPLHEVICQVRFPPILRIESDPPSEFQERVRSRLPLLERTTNALAGKLPREVLKAIGAPAPTDSYSFISEDSIVTASLSSESLSLSTKDYVCWEDFRADLMLALESLQEIYAPSFYSRIGLRYQNVINQDTLQLERPWAELLRPEVAGELSIDEWARNVVQIRKLIRCRINEDGDHFILQHGISDTEQFGNRCYALDFDYYIDERTETVDAGTVIDRLHGHSGRAFRWAITPALHDAMGPEQG